MHLDERGAIAAAQVATFGLLFFAGLIFLVKDHYRRMAWALLTLTSVFRLIGGISHIVSEGDPTKLAPRLIYFIMEAAGQGPLLASTLGFLRTVSQNSIDHTFIFHRGMSAFAVIGISGMILAIVGGARSGSAHSESQYDIDMTLRHTGLILFVVLYSGCLGITLYCWYYWRLIWVYRRRILISISIAMPFLLIRMLYGVFSVFAPAAATFRDGRQIPIVPSSSGLGKFSPSSSRWGIYLVMSAIMEWIVVIIHLVTRAITPLDNDRPVDAGNGKFNGGDDGDSEATKLDVVLKDLA